MLLKKWAFFICLCICIVTTAQEFPKWLRYSAISPDGNTIVFTYKGDLYTVSSKGGTAIALTTHEAHDYMPVWSADSKTIAFASDRFGNFDIFTMPAAGGSAKRLTFHSANEYPYSFSNNNQMIVFGASRMDVASNRTFPTGSQPELYKVSINGGKVSQVLSTPSEEICFSSNEKLMLYQDKKGGENTWRKHHTSSIARDIWLYNFDNSSHKKITSFAGEDRTPHFINNNQSIAYLSEETGSFNIHTISINGGKSTAITSFKKHPIRFLTTSKNGTMCFSFNGEIYTTTLASKPQKVNINIAVDSKANNEKIVNVNGNVRDMAVSPNGKEVAFIFRGEVFVSSVDGGITKRITNTVEQERSVSFSTDGKTLLYSSERGNSWKIFETKIIRAEEPYFYASTVLRETPVIANDKENYQPTYSPNGKEIAFVEDRTTLKIYNIANKQTRTILNDNHLSSMSDNNQYFQFSNDGKYLLFKYSVPGIAPREVGLVETTGKGRVYNLTQSGFDDENAKWILGGKGMMWFSNKDGLKSVAQSGNSQNDVYAMFFTQEAFDKFKLSKEDAALAKEMADKKATADTSKKKTLAVDSVVIEWDGLTNRKAKLTLHSSSLSDALVSKDGETLYYLARFERGYNVWTTNLKTRETKILTQLNSGGGNMVWDKDQKSIFLNTDGNIYKIDPSSGKQETIKINGETTIDIASERAFMFEHVWRRTKKTFYTAGYHGINWDSYKQDYLAYLPHIGNNYEFSEMLSELLGELNVSHSGSSYFNNVPTADATASLGVFFDETYTGNGYKIEEIIKDGPLAKANINIAVGDIITAIDGEEIMADKDLSQYLNRKAGKNTLLIIGGKELVIKPISIADLNGLLYNRWVRKNQDEVEKMSNGTLGYIHIPGMNDGAYRNVYEEAMGKYAQAKGLVVDTRFNGGGDLVADLATFLSGKKFMDYTTDTRSNGFEPNFRWTKPSISIANEANYSDGHCYAFTYKELNLGKLVGMPVPGTCTFAGWEVLQDNSIRWGVPPLGCKTVRGEYLENLQTNPDIQLTNDYNIVIKGKDQQLETAVKELLKTVQ